MNLQAQNDQNGVETPERRGIVDHCTSRLNRECIDVYAVDKRNGDGANHTYRIDVRAFENPKNAEPSVTVMLPFQDGGLKDVGANGITEQALLAVVLDRLRGFNDGPYRCPENSMMITKIEEALMWGEKRANDRARRGLEGQRLA